MRLTLLHTSDWHLGHSFRAFGADAAAALSAQRLRTVDHVLRVAASHEVDAILCAGDLFDSAQPSEGCWKGLVDLLAAMTHRCPVFVLPGTHDPLGPDSVYASTHPFRASLPAWVRVVDAPGFEAPLGDGAVLVAEPTVADADEAAARLARRSPDGGPLRVGMVHRQPGVPGDPGVAASCLDYLALGGSHTFGLERAAGPDGCGLAVSCGAPESTRFADGAGAVVVVQLRSGDRAPRYRQQRVGHFRWEDVRCTQMAQLRALAQRDDLQRTVLRLSVELDLSLAEKDELTRLIALLAGSEVDGGRVAWVERIDRRGERLAQDAFATHLPDHIPQVMHEVHARLRARLLDPELRPATEMALMHLHKLIAEVP